MLANDRDDSSANFLEKCQISLLPAWLADAKRLRLIEDHSLWVSGPSSVPVGCRAVDVQPFGGSLVLFDSVALPHEVRRTTGGKRLALAGWFHEKVALPRRSRGAEGTTSWMSEHLPMKAPSPSSQSPPAPLTLTLTPGIYKAMFSTD